MNILNVAVIFGGTSSEHDISKKSAITILSAMSKEKYNIIPIYIDKNGKWLMYDGNIENIKNLNWSKFSTSITLNLDRDKKSFARIIGDKIKNIPVDVIFPVLHGKYGEDGTIQGLFELAQIPYVGCNSISSAICMDKLYTKIVVDSIHIKQAKYLSFRKQDIIQDLDIICRKIRYTLGYPCFIKPARAGSSIGISKAHNKKEVIKGLNIAIQEDDKIIIEKFINMRELECAILGTYKNKDLVVSCVGEVKCEKNFYSFDSKYNDPKSKTIIPADIPKEIEKEIKNKAIKIFNSLNCSGLSRIDFFYNLDKNIVLFNEINTMPGFTDISMYPMLLKNSGIELPEIIDRLIDMTLNNDIN